MASRSSALSSLVRCLLLSSLKKKSLFVRHHTYGALCVYVPIKDDQESSRWWYENWTRSGRDVVPMELNYRLPLTPRVNMELDVLIFKVGGFGGVKCRSLDYFSDIQCQGPLLYSGMFSV